MYHSYLLLSPMTYSLRIADMPLTERPRERLLTYGPKVLATAELIAILLECRSRSRKTFGCGFGAVYFERTWETPA